MTFKAFVCLLGLLLACTTAQAELQLLSLPAHKREQASTMLELQRDPFNWSNQQLDLLRQARQAEEDPFTDFTMQAILWNDRQPQAVVNGQLVKRGDEVDGVRVATIRANAVVLQSRGKRRTLTFGQPDINFGFPPGVTYEALSKEQSHAH